MDDMPSFNDKFTIKLTARQQQILELIQNTIASTGSPPTRAEIATEFDSNQPMLLKSIWKLWHAKEPLSCLAAHREVSAWKVIRLNPSTHHALSSLCNSFRFLYRVWCSWHSPSLVGLPQDLPSWRKSTLSKASVLRAACLRASQITCSKSKAWACAMLASWRWLVGCAICQWGTQWANHRGAHWWRSYRQAVSPHQRPDWIVTRKPRIQNHHGWSRRTICHWRIGSWFDTQHHVDVNRYPVAAIGGGRMAVVSCGFILQAGQTSPYCSNFFLILPVFYLYLQRSFTWDSINYSQLKSQPLC